jgi:hypothetical protein
MIFLALNWITPTNLVYEYSGEKYKDGSLLLHFCASTRAGD